MNGDRYEAYDQVRWIKELVVDYVKDHPTTILEGRPLTKDELAELRLGLKSISAAAINAHDCLDMIFGKEE